MMLQCHQLKKTLLTGCIFTVRLYYLLHLIVKLTVCFPHLHILKKSPNTKERDLNRSIEFGFGSVQQLFQGPNSLQVFFSPLLQLI